MGEMKLLSMAHGILAGLAWGGVTLLTVGAVLLRYFFPPGTNWFRIHEYCNSLKSFFTITAFDLALCVIEKYGRKKIYFRHVIMGLAIFILVVFQILVEFSRPHLPPPPHPKRKNEEM